MSRIWMARGRLSALPWTWHREVPYVAEGEHARMLDSAGMIGPQSRYVFPAAVHLSTTRVEIAILGSIDTLCMLQT